MLLQALLAVGQLLLAPGLPPHPLRCTGCLRLRSPAQYHQCTQIDRKQTCRLAEMRLIWIKLV